MLAAVCFSAEDSVVSFVLDSPMGRLDKSVANYFSSVEVEVVEKFGFLPSRTQVSRWIEAGRVTVDSVVVTDGNFRPSAGVCIEVDIPSPRTLTISADSSVRFEIVFQDSHLLVINKPAGLVVHPGAGCESGTLVNGLLAELGDELRTVGDALRPGIVHRLDKDTSGLMVIAKTDEAFRGLTIQFVEPRTIKRSYIALTTKCPGGEPK